MICMYRHQTFSVRIWDCADDYVLGLQEHQEACINYQIEFGLNDKIPNTNRPAMGTLLTLINTQSQLKQGDTTESSEADDHENQYSETITNTTSSTQANQLCEGD